MTTRTAIPRDAARRTMGWLTLMGGFCVLAFWAAYLSGFVDLGQDQPLVAAFESAFPLADAVFAVALIAASYGLLRNHRVGVYALVASGAISLYLGLLDLTFYGRMGVYQRLDGQALIELTVNMFCVVGGVLGLWMGWRFSAVGAARRRRRNSLNVSDRVVLVTGSASGIGAATARALAERGARLVLADIDRDALERQRRELAPVARSLVAIPTDVADANSVAELVEAALMAAGRVDVLINCAGVLYPGPTDRIPERLLRKQVEINLLGTILTTRELLPYFRRRESGHLIHIASLGGLVPLPGECTYSATKFAVRGFCLSLALELRDTPIRVTVIHPDSTDTAQLRAEALHSGSSLSFTSRPLPAACVARAIVNSIERPRLEVYVPRLRGGLVRIASLVPRLLGILYPLLDLAGRRNRERYARSFAAGAPAFDPHPEGVAR